jgi:sulfofructose kinase
MKCVEIDVLCVGLATYDLVYMVDRHPGPDEKCFAAALVRCGGGPAANAAVTVARLGGVAAFSGYLGRDLFGEMHFRELVAEGVLAKDLVARGNSPCPLSSIFVKPDGKRTIVTYRGSTPVLQPGQVDFTTLKPRAIVFDGHQPAISIPLAASAREKNIPTVLDAGSVNEGTTALAPLCGYLVASEKFARDFSGEKDPAPALSFLSRVAPVAVVTLGEAGLVWKSGQKSGSLEAYEVEAVDTTGAGDIFHGAFALAAARGEELSSALRFASAAAGLGCTKAGARTSIPTKEEVEAFMRRP